VSSRLHRSALSRFANDADVTLSAIEKKEGEGGKKEVGETMSFKGKKKGKEKEKRKRKARERENEEDNSETSECVRERN